MLQVMEQTQGPGDQRMMKGFSKEGVGGVRRVSLQVNHAFEDEW
jgi:hypothetical protein